MPVAAEWVPNVRSQLGSACSDPNEPVSLLAPRFISTGPELFTGPSRLTLRRGDHQTQRRSSSRPSTAWLGSTPTGEGTPLLGAGCGTIVSSGGAKVCEPDVGLGVFWQQWMAGWPEMITTNSRLGNGMSRACARFIHPVDLAMHLVGVDCKELIVYVLSAEERVEQTGGSSMDSRPFSRGCLNRNLHRLSLSHL